MIVPSYSFIASSFAIVQAGRYSPSLPMSPTITPSIRPKFAGSSPRGPRALWSSISTAWWRIWVPSLEISREHGLKVIEDCAQCIGGEYKGNQGGADWRRRLLQLLPEQALYHRRQGGMVITNDEELGWECRSFRDHGYDVKTRMSMLALEEKLPTFTTASASITA